MNYEIKNLVDDLQKKLSIYDDNILKKFDSLSPKRYEKFAQIILKKDELNLDYMINRLENYYKSGIWIEEKKLKFHHSEISQTGSFVYKNLYYEDEQNAFDRYIKIFSSDNIYGDTSSWLDINFECEAIKNNFLDKALEYIINNQNQSWESEFSKIDYQRYNWLPKTDDIPKSFQDNEELYFWLKQNRNEETLMFMGDRILKTLVYKLINLDTFNPYQIEKNRVLKLLESCKNDYITIGRILTNKNLKLNCFFLQSYEYALFGFSNLYDKFGSFSNEYNKKYYEIVSNQLIEIFFKHFYNLHYKKEFFIS